MTPQELIDLKVQAEKKLGINWVNRAEKVNYVKARQLLSDPQTFEVVHFDGDERRTWTYRLRDGETTPPPFEEWS